MSLALFFLKIAFGYSGSFVIPSEYGDFFPMSIKQAIGTVMEITLNL